MNREEILNNNKSLSLSKVAIELISNEYAIISGIEELADILSITKHHLIREFKSEVGISPGKFLSLVRISMAKRHLESSDFSVDSIAGLVGYSCGNYFSKAFKKTVGMSPLQYREYSSKHIEKINSIENILKPKAGIEFL